MMEGDIWVESDPGKGSTFIFTAQFDLGEEKENVKLIPTKDLLDMKVLVVDDSISARQILSEYLASMQFSVINQASSGQKGIDMIVQAVEESDPYKIVFMDWKMPGMDGIEAGKKIRSLVSKDTKIIMMTANARDEIQDRIQNAGFDGLMIKPVSPSDLLDTIMVAFDKNGASLRNKHAKKNEYDLTKPIWGANILLVEDNEINQQVATEILEGLGLIVSIAENGQIAVDKVKEKSFDAVLMDIQMPVLDGYEATQIIRKDKTFANLPIIAMTANAMTQDKEDAKEAGLDDHIAKPIDIPALITTLLKWVEHKERQVPSDFEKRMEQKLEKKPIELEDNLPGISVEIGLSRVGSNKELYIDLLKKFVRDFADSAPSIKKALELDDLPLAKREAHTLKGVAGNIGASEVQQEAGKIESAISNKELTGLSNNLNSLELALSVVISGLKSAPVLNSESRDKSETELLHGDMVTLKNFLDKLYPAVQKKKPKPSKDIIAEMGKYIWPDDISPKIKEINKLVGKYKFKIILPLLEELISDVDQKQ